jgi:hypothetical protein
MLMFHSIGSTNKAHHDTGRHSIVKSLADKDFAYHMA